jgi:hypothetical protein
MHPAWYITDIQYLIFQHLDPTDLAKVASTCRLLSEAAITELWKTIRSTSVLLNTLPSDYRSRPLEPNDLDRLCFYTSKILNVFLEGAERKILYLPQPFKSPKTASHGLKSWEQLWEEIASLKSSAEIFSKIRCFRISNVVERLLIPFVGISGSNLAQVYIKIIHERQNENIIKKLLSRLEDTPKLTYLFIRDADTNLIPPKLIRQSPLNHLRLEPRMHVTWGTGPETNSQNSPIRPEIFGKSSLEKLTIWLSSQWYSPKIEQFPKYLPNLKALWLNLALFAPRGCDRRCINITPLGWTCYCPEGSTFRIAAKCRAPDCGRRSPGEFLKRLDNPELELLNIKFPNGLCGDKFLDIVSTLKKSCRLSNLTELVLGGAGWFIHCGECALAPTPEIKPAKLREAISILLPLPRLKVLRVSVAPNMLDILDLRLYKSFAAGLSSLQKLYLGHSSFVSSSLFHGTVAHEQNIIHHLAAFCQMLPNLRELHIGALAMNFDDRLHPEFVCPHILTLSISPYFVPQNEEAITEKTLAEHLTFYFPNSDFVRKYRV